MFLFVFVHLGRADGGSSLSWAPLIVVKSDGNCHQAWWWSSWSGSWCTGTLINSSSSLHYKTRFWPALHWKVSHIVWQPIMGFWVEWEHIVVSRSPLSSLYQNTGVDDWENVVRLLAVIALTGILFGQQICPPVLPVTWSPPSPSHYIDWWRWFIVSLLRTEELPGIMPWWQSWPGDQMQG